MHIPHNGTGILVLAKANSVVLGADRFNEMNIWEHRAQGSESLEYFRWQSVDDVPPKVVLKISVVRAAPPSKAHMEDFIIAGGIHGGIQIKSLSSR
jgi:hypothetical protein